MVVRYRRVLQVLSIVTLYGGLIFLGQAASDWVLNRVGMGLWPSTQGAIHKMVLAASALYVVLLAMPFIPAVEIGLGLMTMLGPSICFLVYLSTVTALTLAFTIGRLVPTDIIISIFRRLKLAKAHALVARIAPMSIEERLDFLISRLPASSARFLLRHRYLAIAVLLNVPGNAFIGGGGGIALVAGLSRLFSFPAFIITIAFAVAPVPLAFYLTGGF